VSIGGAVLGEAYPGGFTATLLLSGSGGTSNADIAIPHMAWPFKFAGVQLAHVEQDSIDDLEQSVHAWLVTPRGSRPLSPDFGIDDPTFGPGLNAARLQADIEASEDGRASVTVTVTAPDGTGQQGVNITVDLPA
jgi:hypothetical protein